MFPILAALAVAGTSRASPNSSCARYAHLAGLGSDHGPCTITATTMPTVVMVVTATTRTSTIATTATYDVYADIGDCCDYEYDDDCDAYDDDYH